MIWLAVLLQIPLLAMALLTGHALGIREERGRQAKRDAISRAIAEAEAEARRNAPRRGVRLRTIRTTR